MSYAHVAADYAEWVRSYCHLTDSDRDLIRERIERLPIQAEFLFVPLLRAGDQTGTWLRAAQSLTAQLYHRWRIIVPNAWSASFAVVVGAERVGAAPFPPDEAEGERCLFLHGAMEQLARCEDCFIIPLLPGAVLHERLLYEYARVAACCNDVQLLYADEDEIDEAGTHCRPRFKTAFDAELMLGRDALGAAVALRQDLLLSLGGLRPERGPVRVALHELCLRASEILAPEHIVHVPAVLLHQTRVPGMTLDWDAAAARRVVQQHLRAIGETGAVHPAPLAPTWCRVERPLPEHPPLVSVIVPTRDHADLLARCVDGVLSRTDYPAIELLIVDNGSRERATLSLFEKLAQDPRIRILHQPGPFNFSALNNAAATEAHGEVLLLLNNDIDVLSPNWLREMVAQALRPDVGAVGAKLLYEDGRVQHAGVVLAPGPLLSHQLRLASRDDPGPQGELALARTVLAVTGACLAMRRSVFQEVGGLDERQLRIAFNDIDFCLRLGDHGYRIVWTPFAELLHLESASRGPEDAIPERAVEFQRELAAIRHRWAPELRADPFHNPNLLFGWDETRLAAPPRRLHPGLDVAQR